MKVDKSGGPRVAIAAVALVVAALAHADARSSIAERASALGGKGAPLGRSDRASAAEAAIARSDLAGKLEAVLGDAFGGVWFDPASARLHVGVTSPASRRNAEAVAAQAGLGTVVTETAVDSTWGQLEAAQERWSRRLADLFERGEATTALLADRNAVEVELGSSVSVSRREALKREAAAENVSVLLGVASRPHLRARAAARCVKFEKFKGFCDPTIVAGMTIESEIFEQKIVRCTSGPTVIQEDRSKPTAATETFLLTAGHCIEKSGGPGKKWHAYNKAEEEETIGAAAAYLNDETGDVGAIKVDTSKTSYWAEGDKPNPVVPTIATWSKAVEADPFAVEGKANPVQNTNTCFSGQRSGTNCGTIEATGVEIEISGKKKKNLAKVVAITSGVGDSGAAFFSEASKNTVEGTLVGVIEIEETEEGEVAFFQSLTHSFAELKKQKSLALELLTKAKETRHPVIKGGKYPATVHGGLSGEAVEKFKTEAGTVECGETTHHAVVSEETSTLVDSPEYPDCAVLGVAATVTMEECGFEFHATEKASTDNYKAHVDVTCPAGQSIKIVAGTCKAEVKAQTGLTTTDLVDDTGASPKKDVTVRPTVTKIAYTVTQDGFLCPFTGTGEKTDGEYTSSEAITVTGQNPSSPSEKIDVEVAG